MKTWLSSLLVVCGMSGACTSQGAMPATPDSSGGGAGKTSAGTGGATPGRGGSLAAGGRAEGGTGGVATAGGAGGGGGSTGGAAGAPDAAAAADVAIRTDVAADPARTTVVLFLIDGVMYEAVKAAVAAGAKNLGFVLDNGVRVETAHSTSPAAVIELPAGAPGGREPWAHATSGNVAVHTGCHLFESRQMDDIFLAARAAGIKSVFSGGDDNYAVFTTPDFHYGMRMDDDTTIDHAILHLRNDGARLLRIHLQRIRDAWSGPGGKTDPGSAYVNHLLMVDGLLGRLVQALKEAGVWEHTYLVLAADHGMGQTGASGHPSSTPSSWNPFMAFFGPDIKKGATIPYAELPDLAVTAAHMLGLPPLKGHLDNRVNLPVKGATGTVLTNIFVGAPAELAHPRYIEKCLAMGAACMGSGDDYAPYRTAMLGLLR